MSQEVHEAVLGSRDAADHVRELRRAEYGERRAVALGLEAAGLPVTCSAVDVIMGC